ncbi:hypothetical protein Tco_0865897 [Tanacetum coccineum]
MYSCSNAPRNISAATHFGGDWYLEMDINKKNKNEAKTVKTEHEMENREKVKVIVAPIIPIFVDSVEGSFGDTIDIDVDVIHPVTVASVVFSIVTIVTTLAQHGETIRGIQEHFLMVPIQEEMTALRFRVDIAEAENASMRATIRTMEAICHTPTKAKTRECKIMINHNTRYKIEKTTLHKLQVL